MIARTTRTAALLLLVATMALAATACGKKGDLEPPEDEPSSFPRQYPDPSSL